jgi:hypothetical protein
VADAFSVERAAAAYAGLYEDLLVRKGRAARES